MRSPSPRAVAASAAAASAPAAHAPLTAAQQHYLALAQAGVAQAKAALGRSHSSAGMTRGCSDRDRYPLATIWDIVPLFESLDAIAIAQPTAGQPRAR